MVALVSLSLAAAPVCWSHYQVLQYRGVALLLANSIRLRAWRTTAAVVLCFLLLHHLPETALNHYHDEHSGWTAASPVTLYVWTSVAPLACLGLFGLALAHVKRGAGMIGQIPDENAKGQFFWRFRSQATSASPFPGLRPEVPGTGLSHPLG
jgi:hypothetical protein